MKSISKTILFLLLLCLLGAAWKGYGQEVEPGTVLWKSNIGKEFDVADSMSLEIGKTYGTATALVQLDGSASSKVEIISLSRAPFGFSFKTELDSTYIIEASHDLRKWREIGEVQGTGSSVKFIERRKALFTKQYYRVKKAE